MGNKLVVILVGAVLGAVSLSGCATETDYYEGEIVPTRPIRKPSLDPNTPVELGGGGQQTENPPIFEGKQMGQQDFSSGEHMDGRIAWAEEITKNDVSFTYLHDVDSWTGVDSVTVVDEYGAEIGRFTTRYNPDRSNISITK
jgi:hypothetical protein